MWAAAPFTFYGLEKKLNMARNYKSIEKLSHDEIEAHILDPDKYPLPERCRTQFKRVLSAARLLDDYPDDTHVIRMMQAKFDVSSSTVRRDIALARQLYKSRHTFDWDFWQAWMIKDQLELIRECRLSGDLQEWNRAKKVLRDIIGDRPAGVEDPQRMQANQFFIQINQNGQSQNVSLGDARNYSDRDKKEIIDSLYQPIGEAEAEEIMDT